MAGIRKIWEPVRNGITAIVQGELLLRLHVDKFFIHILYTFLLLWLVILLDMRVEKTMANVERNKAALSEMKIYHAHKTVQMVSLNRISTVQDMLEKEGSDVTLPEKPAVRIRK